MYPTPNGGRQRDCFAIARLDPAALLEAARNALPGANDRRDARLICRNRIA